MPAGVIDATVNPRANHLILWHNAFDEQADETFFKFGRRLQNRVVKLNTRVSHAKTKKKS
jgi:hypothetical protein